MSKPCVLKIVFDGAMGNAFYPEQSVRGHVLVETSERIKIRGIRLTASGTGYASLNGRLGKVQYNGQETYLSMEIPLIGSDEPTSELYLEEGTSRFPFSFQLPPNVPRSFECSLGYIRYKMTASIDRIDTDDVSEVPLVILRSLDLNLEPQHLRSPLVIQSQSPVTSGCCVNGFLDISLALNRGCFVPGETVYMNGIIANRTNATIIRMTLALVQDLELFTSSTKDRSIQATTHSLSTLLEIRRPQIDRGAQQRLDNVSFVVPSVPSSRIDGCKLFNMTYHLKITTIFSFSSSSSFCKEVVIGDVGLPGAFQPHVVTQQPPAYPTSYNNTAISGYPQLMNAGPTSGYPQLMNVGPTSSYPQLMNVGPTSGYPQLMNVGPTSGYPQLMNVDPTVSGYNAFDASSCSQNFASSIRSLPIRYPMNDDYHSRRVENSDLPEVHTTCSVMPGLMGWNHGCEVRPEICLPGYDTNAGNCATDDYHGMTEFNAMDSHSGHVNSMNYDCIGLSETSTVDFVASESCAMSNDCTVSISTGACDS